MATYSLLLGILVIIISWKFFNDWASGLAGFIYGGILFWSIKLFVQLIKTLFGEEMMSPLKSNETTETMFQAPKDSHQNC